MKCVISRISLIALSVIFLLFVLSCGGSSSSDGDGSDSDTESSDSDGSLSGSPAADLSGTPRAITADHNASAAFSSIPDEYIQSAKSTFRIFYGHTSHGSQIITGMEMIESEDSRFAFSSASGAFIIQEIEEDLGYEGDLSWVQTTRDVLSQSGGSINVVMWSWCAGVSDNTEAGINSYLSAMSQLEAEYPGVVFIYMTGHLDGTGSSGNLWVRNNQIRSYCQANNKVLFDFADIESYDPAGNLHPNGTDWCEWCTSWCATQTCPSCGDCAHSQCMNCYQKGKAFWWMLARLAGWGGA